MEKHSKNRKKSVISILVMANLAVVIYFFLGVKYEISLIEKAIISLVSLVLFIFYARKSLSQFYLFSLSSITLFIGLVTAFSSSIKGNGLINLNFHLGVWSIFIITLLFSTGILYLYSIMKNQNKYAILLSITFLVYWVLIAINAKYLDGWLAENYLVVAFIPVIYFVTKYFQFSRLSYSLIFVFMVLHVMGSHYTYSEVPLGYWMQDFFNLDRNHFDRIVHFMFGFLWAYPMREIFKRVGETRGFWSFWIPIELVLALSCVFELIEWAFAAIFGGDLGIAYLGSQGDIWDAQKDMAIAGLGSIITMLIVFFTLMYYDSKSLFKEIKESFKVKSNQLLGEEALIKLSLKNN